jgi:hypothetical protein
MLAELAARGSGRTDVEITIPTCFPDLAVGLTSQSGTGEALTGTR